MKCLFENGPFSGRNHLNFSGGGNQFNLMKGSQLQNTFMHEITGVGVVFFGIPRGQCPRWSSTLTPLWRDEPFGYHLRAPRIDIFCCSPKMGRFVCRAYMTLIRNPYMETKAPSTCYPVFKTNSMVFKLSKLGGVSNKFFVKNTISLASKMELQNFRQTTSFVIMSVTFSFWMSLSNFLRLRWPFANIKSKRFGGF